jgi:dihydroorotate dehydrogenase (NAD+) catalytic subunit
MICGATAVEVGTANFIDPMATVTIVDGLREYCEQNRIPKIESIIGTLETG